MPDEADRVLSRLSDKGKERDYWIEVLKLWALVEDAGIDIDDVQAFTFRPDFLEREKRAQLNRSSYAAKRDVSKWWHNCVRLKDGSLKPIPLTKRPIDPRKKPETKDETGLDRDPVQRRIQYQGRDNPGVGV